LVVVNCRYTTAHDKSEPHGGGGGSDGRGDDNDDDGDDDDNDMMILVRVGFETQLFSYPRFSSASH